METQNHSTETAWNLNEPSTRMKILCQYIGQESTLAGMGTARLSVDLLSGQKNNIADISVLLKSVDHITDDHLLKVFELYNTHHMDEKNRLRCAKDLLDNVMACTDKFLNPFETLAIFDDLRALGYALPYRNWSIAELKDFGIYKLV